MNEQDYIVNATIKVNVQVEVSAQSEDDAKTMAKDLIFDGVYECKDLEEDPVINWANAQNE